MPSDTLLEALVTGQVKRGGAATGGAGAGGAGEGWWGEPTGTIDWCERNYAGPLYYIAEFHNTWSNVFYLLVGLAALARCRRLRLPAQFRACAACIVLTGVFSAAFHATLRLTMQRLDECFENGILIFMLHSDRRVGGGAFAVSLAHMAACTAGILGLSGTFLFCELHLVSVILFALAKFRRLSGAHPRTVRPLVSASAAWTGGGFASWLSDRLACDVTAHLHLHAAWHLCTAVALWCGFQAVSMGHLLEDTATATAKKTTTTTGTKKKHHD